MNPVVCPKCGRSLLNVVSGAVCPGGCGGLYPKVGKGDSAKASNAFKISLLPEATVVTVARPCEIGGYVDSKFYVLKDRGGLFRRVAKRTALDKNQVLAQYDGHAIVIEEDIVTNSILASILHGANVPEPTDDEIYG